MDHVSGLLDELDEMLIESNITQYVIVIVIQVYVY